MKKKTLVLSMFLAALLFSGFNCGGDKDVQDAETTPAKEDSSIIDDISEAITLKKKMECKYKVTDEKGDAVESKSYIQGDKYKTEFTAAGAKQTSIFDGQTIYTWDENTKQGTMMDIDCLDDFKTVSSSDEADTEDFEEYKSSDQILDEGVDVSCRPVAAIDFTIPDDVNFVDQCELLKQQMEALEGIQQQLPDLEGLDIPEY